MIKATELSDIGRTIKPHGINGEIAVTVDNDIDLSTLKCIVFDIEGIFVPFFINSTRLRGSESVLISIDGIVNENQAAMLCPQTIYALNSDIDKNNDDRYHDGLYLSDLIGYTLFDSENNLIGIISDFDDSTQNLLLTINGKNGKKLYIPIADDLIENIDYDNSRLNINIANGLLEL